jgi:hypothetical protein
MITTQNPEVLIRRSRIRHDATSTTTATAALLPRGSKPLPTSPQISVAMTLRAAYAHRRI